jgi:Slime mold cyclic AMP receptor
MGGSTPSNENELIYSVIFPIPIISGAACIIVLLVLLTNKNLRKVPDAHFICVLSIFDGILNIISLLPGVFPLEDSLCVAQGVLIQVFSLSGYLWTGVISYDLYRKAFKPKSRRINIWVYSSVVFILSLMTALFPLLDDRVVYVPGGGWCWFSSNFDGYRFGLFYGIIWMVAAWIIYVNRSVSKHLLTEMDKKTYRKTVGNLKYYPLVLLPCIIPLTLARILERFVVLNTSYKIWSQLVIRSLGFWNSMIYGLHPEVREVLIPKIRISAEGTE